MGGPNFTRLRAQWDNCAAYIFDDRDDEKDLDDATLERILDALSGINDEVAVHDGKTPPQARATASTRFRGPTARSLFHASTMEVSDGS